MKIDVLLYVFSVQTAFDTVSLVAERLISGLLFLHPEMSKPLRNAETL